MAQNKFTLYDLQFGDIVTLRNGWRYFVLNYSMYCEEEEDRIYIDGFHIEYLTYRYSDKWDIMKIARAGQVIWERQKPKEMTLAEISKALGYEVKIIAEANEMCKYREHTVTISDHEYLELLESKSQLDHLIALIFKKASLTFDKENLSRDEYLNKITRSKIEMTVKELIEELQKANENMATGMFCEADSSSVVSMFE